MNTKNRLIAILAVVAVTAAGLLLFFTNRRVRAVFDEAHIIFVLYRAENELMLSTPAGRYYRALFWKSNDDLIRIASQYPENDSEFYTVVAMYTPAIEALLNGKGDRITLTAKQVEAARVEFEWLASVAEPPLRKDIQGELDRFPMENFIGMTAQQAWNYINEKWVPRTPEEQAMSEVTTHEAPTPDIAAIKMDHADLTDIRFDYPAGWSLISSEVGSDPSSRTIFIEPPESGPFEGPSVDRITLRIWPLALDQQGSLDPALSEPAGDSNTVLWRQDLQMDGLRGVKYVWGKPGGPAVFYARLYSEERQLAIQLSVPIRDPEHLQVYGYRYTLGTEYVPFYLLLSSLQLPSEHAEIPVPTRTLIPFTPSPIITTPVPGTQIAHFLPGQPIEITAIHMINTDQGWGIGGLSGGSDHIFRTEDGGNNWFDVTPPHRVPRVGFVPQATGAFRDALTAWIVYDSPDVDFIPVWSTQDGGASWRYFRLDTTGLEADYFKPSDMAFAYPRHGWFLAHLGGAADQDFVALIATLDDGQTWKVLLDPVQDGGIQSCRKRAMAFADAQTGWLTSDCMESGGLPSVFKTIDGGFTWQEIMIPSPFADYFHDNYCGMRAAVPFSDASAVFSMKCEDITVSGKNEHDFLVSTSDAGSTWQMFALPEDFRISGVPGDNLYFVNPQTGLILSRDIYLTQNGGRSWERLKQVSWEAQYTFLDLNTGWAAARDGGEIALVKTTDGGKTWQRIYPVIAP